MFTEIIGNADLYGEAICKCYVYCRDNCPFLCIDEVPTTVVQNVDLTHTDQILTIPIP